MCDRQLPHEAASAPGNNRTENEKTSKKAPFQKCINGVHILQRN